MIVGAVLGVAGGIVLWWGERTWLDQQFDIQKLLVYVAMFGLLCSVFLGVIVMVLFEIGAAVFG